MNSTIKTLITLSTLFIYFGSTAQISFWQRDYHFTKQVSYSTASIKINGITSSYNDFLAVKDTALLKLEIYDKKAATKKFGTEEGENGIVLLTTKTYKAINYVTGLKTDSAKYFMLNKDTIFTKAITEASFLPDVKYPSWKKFLERNLKTITPSVNGAPLGLYRVVVDFIVNENGSLSNINIEEDPGYGTGKEVLRLMSKSPYWQPALYNGLPVKYLKKQVVLFSVSGDSISY